MNDDLDEYYLPMLLPEFISVYHSVNSKKISNHEVILKNLDYNNIEMVKRSISILFSIATDKRMNIQFSTYPRESDLDLELLNLSFFLNSINLTLSMFDDLVNVVLVLTH